jgi:hypothetical protein
LPSLLLRLAACKNSALDAGLLAGDNQDPAGRQVSAAGGKPVTESEWVSCTDPQAMLAFLRDSGRAGERKLRLFAVACYRGFFQPLREDAIRKMVFVAEVMADGAATREEEVEARDRLALLMRPPAPDRLQQDAGAVTYLLGVGNVWTAAARLSLHAASLARARAGPDVREGDPAEHREKRQQAALLRDIFGPRPLSLPPSLAPSVLAWNGGTPVRLARATYQERQLPAGTLDPDRLAVLADALEEAGLTDAELLQHLRGSGPHFRGCYAIDLVLRRG